MPDRRPTASPAEHPLARRLRALLEPSPTPLPRPPRPRLEPARRSRLEAAWQVRAAVRAGMPLEDFLRARLARYLAELPVPSARLPVAIAIDEGRIACRPAAPEGAAPAAEAGADGWAGPLAWPDGPAARQEAAELELRVALLDGEIEGARRRAEEIAHRFAGDVAAGLVAAPPGVDATAEQLGRPPVRSGAPRAALLAVAASALGAEAWQIAVPLLAGAGVDPGAISREAAARPGDVASLVLFALGVTASLFALSHAALAAGAALLAGAPDPRRARWLAAAGAAAGALAGLVAASVAALPRPGAAPAGAALALLLLAVPVGAALVARAAARLEAARGEELARALAWDRERALAIAERDRRLEELRWAEDEVAELERQRETARRRLHELSARAAALSRLAAQAAERERAGLARLAQGLVAALELDRYGYVRLAAARGLPAEPPRRRVVAPRGGAFDVPPGGAPAEVEAGRLAS